MVTRTFSIKMEQSESLRELSQITGIPQSVLLRKALDNLLKGKEQIIKNSNELFAFTKRNNIRR